MSERASVMTEFAVVGPVFLTMLFFVFEIAYDLFLQEVLESTLAVTARQMQIGTTQSQTSSAFMSQNFCPNSFGFLNCNNLFVRVEVIKTSFPSSCTDLSQATTGTLPVTNKILNLASFTSQNGAGLGTAVTSSACDSNTGQGYCTPGPNELVVLSAVYVAPSFLNGYVPNTQLYTYNNKDVRGQFAATAFQTENFTTSAGFSGC